MSRFGTSISELYHHLATSDDQLSRTVRRMKRGLENFEVRFPPVVGHAMRLCYHASQRFGEHTRRVLICQPMFRAYCKECGPNLRTGDFIHYVQGRGDIIVGRDVWLDGKSTFTFAASFAERPTLVIGDGTGIGHACEFVIGKRITIGRNVILSGACSLFDSNGHPSDPVERRNKRPPAAEDVRPITIGDDAWLGKQVIVFPGVRIGECAIVSSGTVVRRHVPAYGVVAGNPAQLIFRLKQPVKDHAEKADIAERASQTN